MRQGQEDCRRLLAFQPRDERMSVMPWGILLAHRGLGLSGTPALQRPEWN